MPSSMLCITRYLWKVLKQHEHWAHAPRRADPVSVHACKNYLYILYNAKQIRSICQSIRGPLLVLPPLILLLSLTFVSYGITTVACVTNLRPSDLNPTVLIFLDDSMNIVLKDRSRTADDGNIPTG
jgi:hypothetical protein